jgi:hypothetical protein
MGVARISRPAFGTLAARLYIDGMTSSEDRMLSTEMPLVGRDVTNATVTVGAVVPSDEASNS